jgi:hypothetical protein
VTTHAPEAEHEGDDERQPPQSDFKDAIGWTVLGIAILVGSVRMDRLESQNINPYTVPGLLPGLLGAVLILLGVLLALRSWRRGAFAGPAPAASSEQLEERKRVAVVTALCFGYAVVLVGHGLPFWLASSIYIAISILVMQRISRDPQERVLGARVWAKAIVIALATSVITHVVFQELFLVRLP